MTNKKDELPWDEVTRYTHENDVPRYVRHHRDFSFFGANEDSPLFWHGRFVPEAEAKKLHEQNTLVNEYVMSHQYVDLRGTTIITTNRIKDIIEENQRLRKALEVYADEKSWFENCSLNNAIMFGENIDEPWLIAQEELKGEK